MSSDLAIFGGTPVRKSPFPVAVTTGEEELHAVVEVMKSGLLSGFVGSPGPEFLGGPRVQRLEQAWCERFEVPFAVSCNSATSALLMAVGACEIGPGDEVILSPYTMSATATAVLFYGGIPVFADIEPDYFCLDPVSVRSRITPRTKAILTTDIHGQSSAMEALGEIAREHDLWLINDSAQAAGAKYQGRFAGTLGDIGIYSLNRHKNIQCGEGGIAVCKDKELALRMQLIRNHGENLTESPGFAPASLTNMIGFNFRMTEIEAAIALEQLKKLEPINNRRIELEHLISSSLADVPGLRMPPTRPSATHIFYMQAILFDSQEAGFARDVFIRAINAEGIPIRGGYLRPLYLEPLYQKQIAIGDSGFPFRGPHYDGVVNYRKGLCPVAEDLYENRTIINPFLFPPLELADMQCIVDAVFKVMENGDKLRSFEEEHASTHSGSRRI